MRLFDIGWYYLDGMRALQSPKLMMKTGQLRLEDYYSVYNFLLS